MDKALERVYLELLRIHKEDPSRRELAWDLMKDLERMWPDLVLMISQRYE